jgi:uncharacterized protein YifN (PemK superfamily)
MRNSYNKVTLEFKLSGFLTKDHSTKEYHNWIKNNVIQLAFSNEQKIYYKCTLDIHVSENRRENEELTIQNHRKF